MALAIALSVCLPAPAGAQDSSPRLGVSGTFSTDQPNQPTTFTLGLRYGSGSGQPPAVRRVLIHAPTGTRFAFGRAGACTASDQELMADPEGACPESSRVGHGQFTAYSGAGPPADPAYGTTEVFRTPTGLLEAARLDGSPAVLGTDRFTVDGEFLSASPPMLPGLGPGGTSSFGDLLLTLTDTASTTTPPHCPADGRWVTQVSVTFSDGATETATGASPCALPARAPRLRVAPRRVRVGRRTAVRVRLVGGSAACRHGALVRLGGLRARTNTRGRARLAFRPRRARRYRLVARAVDCPARRASVRAVRGG